MSSQDDAALALSLLGDTTIPITLNRTHPDRSHARPCPRCGYDVSGRSSWNYAIIHSPRCLSCDQVLERQDLLADLEEDLSMEWIEL